MTRISNRYEAINLSQGFPDFDPPKEITERLTEIAPHGPHQYAVTWGVQNFREALARMSRLKYCDVNHATGRQGIYNMGRNMVFKVIVPISFN